MLHGRIIQVKPRPPEVARHRAVAPFAQGIVAELGVAQAVVGQARGPIDRRSTVGDVDIARDPLKGVPLQPGGSRGTALTDQTALLVWVAVCPHEIIGRGDGIAEEQPRVATAPRQRSQHGQFPRRNHVLGCVGPKHATRMLPASGSEARWASASALYTCSCMVFDAVHQRVPSRWATAPPRRRAR